MNPEQLCTVQKYIEAWAIVFPGGKLTPHVDEFGISMIHGFGLVAIEDMYDQVFENMSEFLVDSNGCLDPMPPESASVITVRVTGLNYFKGQRFEETGQWEMPPHWEMEMEVIGYEQS